MSTRITLDEEGEANLAKLQKTTGRSPADVVKKALASEIERSAALTVGEEDAKSPWEVYKELDLGPGGDALAPAREAKKAIREILAEKHRRNSK